MPMMAGRVSRVPHAINSAPIGWQLDCYVFVVIAWVCSPLLIYCRVHVIVCLIVVKLFANWLRSFLGEQHIEFPNLEKQHSGLVGKQTSDKWIGRSVWLIHGQWSTEVPLRRCPLCLSLWGPLGDTPPIRNNTLLGPYQAPRGQTPRSPRPKVTSVLSRHGLGIPWETRTVGKEFWSIRGFQ